MRAEAQAHIDQINAATALLRRFLDWDRALKRLDERVQLLQAAMRAIPVEEPAEQRRCCIDLVDMGLRFSAHDGSAFV